MMDQVGKYMTKGLATQFFREARGDLSVISRVLEGEYQLVFISLDALLQNKKWRHVLSGKFGGSCH